MTKSRTGHTLLLLWISSQTPGDQFKGLQSESVLSPCMHINSCSLCETSDQNLCWWNIATDRRQSLIWIIPDVSWGKRSELQESASQQLYPINLFEFCSSPMVTSVQETKPFHFIQFRTKCKHKAKAFFAAGADDTGRSTVYIDFCTNVFWCIQLIVLTEIQLVALLGRLRFLSDWQHPNFKNDKATLKMFSLHYIVYCGYTHGYCESQRPV